MSKFANKYYKNLQPENMSEDHSALATFMDDAGQCAERNGETIVLGQPGANMADDFGYMGLKPKGKTKLVCECPYLEEIEYEHNLALIGAQLTIDPEEGCTYVASFWLAKIDQPDIQMIAFFGEDAYEMESWKTFSAELKHATSQISLAAEDGWE